MKIQSNSEVLCGCRLRLLARRPLDGRQLLQRRLRRLRRLHLSAPPRVKNPLRKPTSCRSASVRRRLQRVIVVRPFFKTNGMS